VHNDLYYSAASKLVHDSTVRFGYELLFEQTARDLRYKEFLISVSHASQMFPAVGRVALGERQLGGVIGRGGKRDVARQTTVSWSFSAGPTDRGGAA